MRWGNKEHASYNEAKQKVNELFKALRKKGYIAKQNYLCCGSCGAYELGQYFSAKGIPEGDQRKAVTYCRQSGQHFKETANVYLNWGGDGHEIVATAVGLGIPFIWDGTKEQRIKLVFAL